MKKKHNIQVLVLLVGLIWGIIAYQLYWYMYPKHSLKDPIQKETFTKISIPTQHLPPLDTLRRDPFTGRLYQKEHHKKIPKTIPPARPFPSIKFHGVIHGETPVFIISINDVQQLMSIGTIIQEVQLLRGNGKTVLLQYGTQQQRFSIVQ